MKFTSGSKTYSGIVECDPLMANNAHQFHGMFNSEMRSFYRANENDFTMIL